MPRYGSLFPHQTITSVNFECVIFIWRIHVPSHGVTAPNIPIREFYIQNKKTSKERTIWRLAFPHVYNNYDCMAWQCAVLSSV